jgi:putative transposase
MPNKTALFRLSILGTLTSRINLEHGEIKKLIETIAKQHFIIPNSSHVQVSARTIERWYANWQKFGLEGLTPKPRKDKGSSKLDNALKKRLCELKKENMCRSVNTLRDLLYAEGYGRLARASIHRYLQQQNLSQHVVSDAPTIERRQFEAKHACDIWYGEVMHGPSIMHEGKEVKTYLVSYMDDASRLITHTEFCLNEQAVSVAYVLREAVMRRGLPKRLIVDNGSGYRCSLLIGVCARLSIRLIFSRPYEPESKGKLERWHRTVRAQFINELQLKNITDLSDLNARLHAWLEEVYHQRAHEGLNHESPAQRFRKDIVHTRRLGDLAKNLDEIFYDRTKRRVNKTAAIRYNGKQYEVAYQYAKKSVHLVFDPYTKEPKFIEDNDGMYLSAVTPLDKYANLNRERQRPKPIESNNEGASTSTVENALERHANKYKLEE